MGKEVVIGFHDHLRRGLRTGDPWFVLLKFYIYFKKENFLFEKDLLSYHIWGLSRLVSNLEYIPQKLFEGKKISMQYSFPYIIREKLKKINKTNPYFLEKGDFDYKCFVRKDEKYRDEYVRISAEISKEFKWLTSDGSGIVGASFMGGLLTEIPDTLADKLKEWAQKVEDFYKDMERLGAYVIEDQDFNKNMSTTLIKEYKSKRKQLGVPKEFRKRINIKRKKI